MDKAILFGVASALLYGVTDFVARFANKSSGVLATMLWGQGFLSAVLTIAVVATHKFPDGATLDWLLLMASNLAVVAGTGCLYYGLAIGRITVVSPVMACYGAVSALLAIATGEPMTIGVGAGLLLAVIGAILAARSGERATKAAKTSGWLPASGAALLYGVGFWLQGKYSIPVFGPLAALWVYYLSATAIVAVICLLRRENVRPGNLKNISLILGTAILAGGGYAALVAGQTTGSIAVVTALSAASTAITVVLAFLFLKAKPGMGGWLGVAGVAIGIALVHLSGGS
ncbi:MAG: DMT family transporter [Asticcacaulis sp.]|nr:DMT family transporter [Asticcacaulis sp.]